MSAASSAAAAAWGVRGRGAPRGAPSFWRGGGGAALFLERGLDEQLGDRGEPHGGGVRACRATRAALDLVTTVLRRLTILSRRARRIRSIAFKQVVLLGEEFGLFPCLACATCQAPSPDQGAAAILLGGTLFHYEKFPM